MDEKLDTGDIWVQKSIELPYPLTSGEAHNLLKNEIVDLFKRNWKIFTLLISHQKNRRVKATFTQKMSLRLLKLLK